jgi:hypothetical protein
LPQPPSMCHMPSTVTAVGSVPTWTHQENASTHERKKHKNTKTQKHKNKSAGKEKQGGQGWRDTARPTKVIHTLAYPADNTRQDQRPHIPCPLVLISTLAADMQVRLPFHLPPLACNPPRPWWQIAPPMLPSPFCSVPACATASWANPSAGGASKSPSASCYSHS